MEPGQTIIIPPLSRPEGYYLRSNRYVPGRGVPTGVEAFEPIGVHVLVEFVRE